MPKIPSLIKGSPYKQKPIPSAHALEFQYVYTKGEWADGANLLSSLFPREARTDRPASWYSLIRATHWPGALPPGNGPFFLSEWVIDGIVQEMLSKIAGGDEDAVRKQVVQALTKAGFTKMVVHVAFLPPDGSYLVSAMRAAGSFAWTVDPRLYRAYIYPSLAKFSKKTLRSYNTEPWRL